MNDSKYALKDGEIFREGVKIATRDNTTGTIDYMPDCDRYRAPVSSWLKEQGMDKPPVTPAAVAARQAKATFVGSNPAAADGNARTEPEFRPEGGDDPTPEQVEIARLRNLLAAAEAKNNQPTQPAAPAVPKPLAKPVEARFISRDEQTGHVRPTLGDGLMDPLKLRTYPDAPKYDHRGDKTPAFVDWLFANHPHDAEVRYLNRKIAGTPYDERIAALRADGKL